ncbi:uncharacterized protein LOC108143405 [Drosophila elegans]|uniref:uncharacterized protein LOC108143405 n=1 Tax=Drosophila elegans TaxID=30023 RepID=UPI0007E70549|nr:uncharacterized protein LOC108143405 [Drosophila elegans]
MKQFALFSIFLLILVVGLAQMPQQVAAQGQNGPPLGMPPRPPSGNGNGNQQGGQGLNGQNN